MPRVPFVLAGDRHAQEAGVAERPAQLPRPRQHRLRLVQPARASSRATSSGSTTSSPRSRTSMNGLAQIYASWITRFKVDGFRVDTAKHVNAAFFRLWVPKIRAAARSAGIADFPIFGEVTLNDAVDLSDVRARPRAAAGARLPVPAGRDRATPSGASGARGVAQPPRRRRLLPHAERRRPGVHDLPRQPRHGPRGAADPARRRRA